LKPSAAALQAAPVRTTRWMSTAAAALLTTSCARDAQNALDAGADATSADGAVDPVDAAADAAPDATADATADAAVDAGADPACLPGSGGNPIVAGWYADPDMRVYGGRYWIYPTYSAPYAQQTFLDAFSSSDLVRWTRHPRILDTSTVTWATRAIWAPSPIERDGTYFLYFGANDIQRDSELGGIGVATAKRPDGPFVDALGHPLIGAFHNGAQPIDQHVFLDDDGQAYLYYGGHGHCNVAKLDRDMTSLGQFDDGTTFREITPPGYVEGALMFKRRGVYYLMWSEGGWTGPDYRVSYSKASSPLGPFTRLGTILGQDAAIATGSGHNTVVNVPGTDDWYIVYHRRPLGETDGNHRVLAYDRLTFRADGTIAPVEMTTRDAFCDDNALGWTTRGGAWTAADGRYTVAPHAEAKSLLIENHAILAYAADVTVGASGDAGLLFRVSSPADGVARYRGYYAGIDAGRDELFVGRSDGSAFTRLASATVAIAPDTAYRLEVVASGEAITARVGGGAPLSVTDAAYSAGATGLLAHDTAARFDDVVVGRPPGVVFYEHGAFGGRAIALPAGSYTRADLATAGIADNAVSSLRVPAGTTVEVFDGDDFTGTAWTFTEDTALVPAAANDAMTSVRVRAP
jgi:hypothetical protein